MPNLDQQSTKLLNLTVLQRIDPFIEEILIMAAHVTFYEFNIDLSQWCRKDVEGSLFVVKRSIKLDSFLSYAFHFFIWYSVFWRLYYTWSWWNYYFFQFSGTHSLDFSLLWWIDVIQVGLSLLLFQFWLFVRELVLISVMNYFITVLANNWGFRTKNIMYLT